MIPLDILLHAFCIYVGSPKIKDISQSMSVKATIYLDTLVTLDYIIKPRYFEGQNI